MSRKPRAKASGVQYARVCSTRGGMNASTLGRKVETSEVKEADHEPTTCLVTNQRTTLEIVSKSRKACCVLSVFPRVTSEDFLYPYLGKGLTGQTRRRVRNTTLRAFARFDTLRQAVRNPFGISSP